MTLAKTNFATQVAEMEVREYNSAVTSLAYSARTLISDIEKLKAALDLFETLEAKLDEVDDLSADQIRELNTEFLKARSNFLSNSIDGDLIVSGTITASQIPAGAITSSKLAINNLVARK